MAHEIVILAVDDCVGLSIMGPADLFNTANLLNRHEGHDRDVFRTRIVSVDGKSVATSGGHKIGVEASLEEIRNPSVIFLPGISMGAPEALLHRISELDQLSQKVIQHIGSKTILAASCTGTLIAAQTKMLEGKRATTTWWIEDAFRKNFPGVVLEPDEILVDEGNVITSAAGASSLDMSLYLIAKLAGPHLARMCARFMVIDNGRQSQRPYTIEWHEKVREPLIEKADAWIRNQNLVNATVENLADYLGLSQRTLLRRFQQHTGDTPQRYILNIKIEEIRVKLESTKDSIASIASEFGFSDENALRRAFSKHTGVSPSQYRKQFKLSFPNE